MFFESVVPYYQYRQFSDLSLHILSTSSFSYRFMSNKIFFSCLSCKFIPLDNQVAFRQSIARADITSQDEKAISGYKDSLTNIISFQKLTDCCIHCNDFRPKYSDIKSQTWWNFANWFVYPIDFEFCSRCWFELIHKEDS